MDGDDFHEAVKEYWNAWELRTLILLSLLLQLLLVILGDRQKYIAGRRFRVFIWSAYFLASWVLDFSLGQLARSFGIVDPLDLETPCKQDGQGNPEFIPFFWAPAFLLHRGGPDTITAYAMQGNEFEILSLLQEIYQVIVVIYVMIKLWWKNYLQFFLESAAIPIFFVGLYKNGERIWVVISKKFGASSINEMVAGPDKDIRKHLRSIGIIPEAKFLYEAHMLFQMFKGLLSDLLLGPSHVSDSRYIISLHETAEIFKVLEAELGFAYDVLYTKMPTAHLGRILRLIGLLLTISALVVFSPNSYRHKYPKNKFSGIDISISYTLLVVGIVLEIYSIMVFLFSDWTMLWIGMQNKACANYFYQLWAFFDHDSKRWSGVMAQHDLLVAIQLPENLWDKFLLALMEKGAKIQGWKKVSEVKDLKQSIFRGLLQRSGRDNIRTLDSLRRALEERGSEVLQRKNCFQDFGWSVVDLEFDQSLLVWHIATSICYWDEFHKCRESSELDQSCRMSQCLSNYMMYLLIEYPSIAMLQKEISRSRYRATKLRMIKKLLDQREPNPNLHDGNIWDDLRERIQKSFPDDEDIVQKIKDDTSAFDGGLCLARSLLEKNFRSGKEKWEMISEVWVEMLIYAAGQCDWKEHAQAVGRGGELITLVSLLKAHLGLTLQRSFTELPSSPLDEEFDNMVTRVLRRTEGNPSLTEVMHERELGPVGDIPEIPV